MHKCRCSQMKLINSSRIIYEGEVSWVMSQVAAAFSAALTSLFYILSQPLYDFITKKPPEKNSHQSLLFAIICQPDLIGCNWIKSGLKIWLKSENSEFKINAESFFFSILYRGGTEVVCLWHMISDHRIVSVEPKTTLKYDLVTQTCNIGW